MLLIHGHNSRDHSLFSDLVCYEEADFAKSHREICLYTDADLKKTYQLFTVFLCEDLPSLAVDLSPQTFHALPGDTLYYEEAPSGEDLLILSTCAGTKRHSRLILAFAGK